METQPKPPEQLDKTKGVEKLKYEAFLTKAGTFFAGKILKDVGSGLVEYDEIRRVVDVAKKTAEDMIKKGGEFDSVLPVVNSLLKGARLTEKGHGNERAKGSGMYDTVGDLGIVFESDLGVQTSGSKNVYSITLALERSLAMLDLCDGKDKADRGERMALVEKVLQRI